MAQVSVCSHWPAQASLYSAEPWTVKCSEGPKGGYLEGDICKWDFALNVHKESPSSCALSEVMQQGNDVYTGKSTSRQHCAL